MDNFNRIQYNFVVRRKQSELKFDGAVTIELRRNHRFRFICNYNFRFDEIPIAIDLSSWKLRRIHYNEKLHIFAINTSNLQTFKLIQMEKISLIIMFIRWKQLVSDHVSRSNVCILLWDLKWHWIKSIVWKEFSEIAIEINSQLWFKTW